MAVAVLNPQVGLRDPLSHENLRQKRRMNPHRNPNPNPNPNRSNRRKRSPSGLRSPPSVTAKLPTKPIVTGQIRILKRGEEYVKETPTHASHEPPSDSSPEKAVSCGGGASKRRDPILELPVPEAGKTRIRFPYFYAGSAFIASPPPSDLPLPAFVVCSKR